MNRQGVAASATWNGVIPNCDRMVVAVSGEELRGAQERRGGNTAREKVNGMATYRQNQARRKVSARMAGAVKSTTQAGVRGGRCEVIRADEPASLPARQK